MFEIFPTKSVVIIFDLNLKSSKNGKSHLECIKKFVIDDISKIESDDRIYVYSPTGELEMNESIGKTVALINSAKHCKFNLFVALKESVFLTGQYDNSHRSIFLFTNRYKKIAMDEIINYDKFNNFDNKFFVYGIGYAYDKNDLISYKSDSFNFNHYSDPSECESDFHRDFSDLIVVR
jgi:hypothetical protein